MVLHDYLEGKETLAAENFGIISRQVYKYAFTDMSMTKFIITEYNFVIFMELLHDVPTKGKISSTDKFLARYFTRKCNDSDLTVRKSVLSFLLTAPSDIEICSQYSNFALEIVKTNSAAGHERARKLPKHERARDTSEAIKRTAVPVSTDIGNDCRRRAINAAIVSVAEHEQTVKGCLDYLYDIETPTSIEDFSSGDDARRDAWSTCRTVSLNGYSLLEKVYDSRIFPQGFFQTILVRMTEMNKQGRWRILKLMLMVGLKSCMLAKYLICMRKLSQVCMISGMRVETRVFC